MAVSDAPTGMRLGMDAPIGRAVFPHDVKTIRALMLSRLATDDISLDWRSNGVVICDTPFINVLE
jgi:hypothetical protein